MTLKFGPFLDVGVDPLLDLHAFLSDEDDEDDEVLVEESEDESDDDESLLLCFFPFFFFFCTFFFAFFPFLFSFLLFSLCFFFRWSFPCVSQRSITFHNSSACMLGGSVSSPSHAPVMIFASFLRPPQGTRSLSHGLQVL